MTRIEATRPPLDEEAPSSATRPVRRRVVVVLHGHEAPVATLALGRRVAGALNKPLHALFTSETPVTTAEIPRLLRLPEDALEGVVLDVAIGEPIERLVDFTEANPTAFVIVGADPDVPGELGVGEFATRAIERSRAPIILVRPDARTKLERILVPLDGTPSTASALEPAGDLARKMGASLDIVLVGEAQHRPGIEHGAMAPPQYVDQPHHEWPAFSGEFLHRFVNVIGHCPCDVPTRFFLGAGDPASEILRYADVLGSDLAVLVWHGLASEEHGAIFRSVLRRAACPVLVLRC